MRCVLDDLARRQRNLGVAGERRHLELAGALQAEDIVERLRDARADHQEPVVPQDHRLAVPQVAHQALLLVHVDRDPFEYEGVAINMDEQERLVRDLGNREAMILRNHGLLVVGASIPQAFDNIFRLERACQLQVTTLACNTEISLPPRKIIEDASHLYQPGVRRKLGLLEWPALIRKLDSIDPSFRE